jgi:hypothetical protein
MTETPEDASLAAIAEQAKDHRALLESLEGEQGESLSHGLPELTGVVPEAVTLFGIAATAATRIHNTRVKAGTERKQIAVESQRITAETQRAETHEREETRREEIRQQGAPPAVPPGPVPPAQPG